MRHTARRGHMAGLALTTTEEVISAPVVRAVIPETLDLANMNEEELAELQLRLIRQTKSDPDVPERKR